MRVEMDEITYLIEFKMDMDQQKALAQIRINGYTEKYRGKRKRNEITQGFFHGDL